MKFPIKKGKLILDWLEKYGIPYDEIRFGKPHVDYFIDDKGIGFQDWNTTKNFLLNQKDNV